MDQNDSLWNWNLWTASYKSGSKYLLYSPIIIIWWLWSGLNEIPAWFPKWNRVSELEKKIDQFMKIINVYWNYNSNICQIFLKMTPFMSKSGLGIYRIFRKNYRTFHKITGMSLELALSKAYVEQHIVIGLISNHRKRPFTFVPDRYTLCIKIEWSHDMYF